jgi:hypothetical protein
MYGCSAGSRTEQPIKEQVQKTDVKPQEDSHATGNLMIVQSCLEFLPDTTLSRSSKVQLSGDLRPFWRVSGRVRNGCAYDVSDVTFFIVVYKKGSSYEQLDTSELTFKGTIAAKSTRGIEEDVQLRIAIRDGSWGWNIYPISGQLSPIERFQKF